MTTITSTHTHLIEQIQLLPEEIARQVADYTQFIIAKYNLSSPKTEQNSLPDRIAKHIGELEGKITTEELMTITRGE